MTMKGGKKDITGFLAELAKWGLVIFLLLPVWGQQISRFQAVRVAAGIFLFIIFSGKVLYDTMIMKIIRQQRTALARDVIMTAAMLLILVIVIGALIFAVGFLSLSLLQKSIENVEIF